MSRRPMSAATKAKIAASLKGNKNAYKHGGIPKAKNHKTKVNHGYTKRRAIGVVGLSAGAALAAGTGVGAPAGLGLAIAAKRAHHVGLMKGHAKATNATLVHRNHKGQAKTTYVPHQPRAITKGKQTRPKPRKVKR